MSRLFLTTLTGVIAASSLAVALPAGAQAYGPPPPPPMDRPRDGDRAWDRAGPPPAERAQWNIQRRIDWMQARIDRGRMDGSLDRREFRRVQMQLNPIRREAMRLRPRQEGWGNPGAQREIEMRLDRLNDEIRWLRSNTEHRPW